MFLLSLGCKKLFEIGMLEVADIRTEAQTAAHKPPVLIRSKIIEACKILRNGGDLEELRLIGKQKRGSNLVTIRVGEQQFTTNISTLCRVKGSFLESLFSVRHPNPAQRSENGEYFIDPSAKFFPYILECLRYGSVLTLPMQEEEKQVLALEADFYGLEDLSKAIRGPIVCTAMFLSDETLKVQANEQTFRMKLMVFDGSRMRCLMVDDQIGLYVTTRRHYLSPHWQPQHRSAHGSLLEARECTLATVATQIGCVLDWNG